MRFATLKSQFIEWRCLSLREARISTVGVALEDEEEGEVIGSSGLKLRLKAAEQDCTAWLVEVMMAFMCPRRGTLKRRG